jgi:hypothetical protein
MSQNRQDFILIFKLKIKKKMTLFWAFQNRLYMPIFFFVVGDEI